MHWKPLQAGDIVDVVAPAARASDEELKKGVAYLESIGLVPRVPDNLQQKDFVFANSDEYRFKHLYRSLTSTDSKAVWCLRGGSGCLHLLPHLANAVKPPKAKLFIGLSDITALHLFLNQQWNWATLHAPVLARMGTHSPEEEKRELNDLLFGRQKETVFTLEPMNDAATREGEITAPLIGGNLTVAHATTGTPHAVRGDGNMLFFEDIGERGYRIDRTLEAMKQAAIFTNAKAVVFGDFVGGNEPDGKSFGEEALFRFARSLQIPVLRGIESGHGPLQRPLPFNAKTILKTGAKSELSITLP